MCQAGRGGQLSQAKNGAHTTMDNQHPSFLGRAVLRSLAIVGVASTLFGALPTLAGTYDLPIGSTTINVSGSDRSALPINGTVPGPTLPFKEREDLVIHVTKTLDEETSLPWHGTTL